MAPHSVEDFAHAASSSSPPVKLDHWLQCWLVVKVLHKTVVGGKYLKSKGVVTKVIDRYVGEVRMEDGVLLRLDQEHLETTLPREGGRLMVLQGSRRGATAVLKTIHVEDFNCDIEIEGHGKELLTKIDYEDVCKLSEQY